MSLCLKFLTKTERINAILGDNADVLADMESRARKDNWLMPGETISLVIVREAKPMLDYRPLPHEEAKKFLEALIENQKIGTHTLNHLHFLLKHIDKSAEWWNAPSSDPRVFTRKFIIDGRLRYMLNSKAGIRLRVEIRPLNLASKGKIGLRFYRPTS